MNPFRAIALSVLLPALAACAGHATRPSEAPEHASAIPVDDASASGDATTAGTADDPWEGFNRSMYAVNDVFDRFLLRPVAKGYEAITPRLVRRGVSNFFVNLQQPVSSINLLLEGHPVQAGSALGRFLLNLGLGVGGILDPATEAGIPLRSKDFGQTLGHWGWTDSRYLVLPLFGPSTLRDGIGKGAGMGVSPVTWLALREGAEVSILYGLDARASVLPYESMLEGAPDRYLLIRDAYMQRRRCQIVDCSGELPDYLLPDYEFEIPDFDTLRH